MHNESYPLINQQQTEENQLELVMSFEQAPVAVAIISEQNLTFRYVNAFYGDLVGRKPEDIINKPLLTALPELEGQGFDKLLQNVIETGKPFIADEVPVDLWTNDMLQKKYVNLTYQPQWEKANQKIKGILVVATDVTEQVLSRKLIEESATKLQIIINNAPLAIGLYVGKDMVIENPNQTFIDILGKGPGIEGMPLREAMPELITEGQPFLKILDDVYTTGVPFSTDGTLIKIFRNGEMTNNYYNFSYTPVMDSEGKTYTIVVIAKDVTEQIISTTLLKESEKSLELKNKELLRINNDLDTFIYTASHDLKAPMSNIEGLLIALRENLTSAKEISEDTNHLLSLMEESIDRFKGTIQDLTDIAKTNKPDEELNEVNLNEVLNDVQFTLQGLIARSDAKIQCDFNIETFQFSRKNAVSILYNLLSNAIKYKHPDRSPHIIVSSKKQDGYILLTIRDNGLGINESYLPKMFTMFKRFHNHVEGTGIGLYIVKRIIDNAGGKIEVESELGVGSLFKIYLRI